LAPKTKIAAPTTEKGYTSAFAGWQSSFGTFFDPFENNPDLLWPNSVRTYTRMARADARISSVLRAVGLPIRRTTWRIAPNGASDEVTAFVARDMGLPIVGEDDDTPKPPMKGRFSWSAHLRQALLCLKFGHSVFERTYQIGADGRAHLDKVSARPASTIAYWDVARDGELMSIQQWPAGSFATGGIAIVGPTKPAGMGPWIINADRLVVYLNEPEDGIPFGNSILRPAWKHWKLKDDYMRIQAVAARRNGMGVPGFTASEAESEDPERLLDYQEIASAFGAGNSAGFAIPAGATFKLYGVEGNLLDIQQAIDYQDRQMALVALAHFLNLDGKGGSYALASVQADTFMESVQTVASDLRDVTQPAIVEDLVAVNWGPDEPVPMLVFDEIGSEQDATAAALNLLALGGLIRPDVPLEKAIRQSMNLPDPDPQEALPLPGAQPGAEPALDAAVAAATRSASQRARQRREHPKGKQQPLF
jgi:hypothetical protein